MIPVYQARFHRDQPLRRGDCMRCCVASVLELHAREVPNFVDAGDGAWLWVDQWCRSRGMDVETIYADDLEKRGLEWPEEEGYLIAAGQGPRGCRHAVVWWRDRLVHDPHPSGGGLVGKPEYYVAITDQREQS